MRATRAPVGRPTASGALAATLDRRCGAGAGAAGWRTAQRFGRTTLSSSASTFDPALFALLMLVGHPHGHIRGTRPGIVHCSASAFLRVRHQVPIGRQNEMAFSCPSRSATTMTASGLEMPPFLRYTVRRMPSLHRGSPIPQAGDASCSIP